MDDQVTLTAYADQVRELIRNDRNEEALAICKHILHYYPKYVVAYRQMGEARLEQGELDDAKELFRRVLSADPEEVVAYAGLAVIFEKEHLYAEAVWHMERAYELAPGNTELHQELLRLYHEMDGKSRARLRLTPGALARLYVQEGLLSHAIQEFRAIISDSPARLDARVPLAETLWRVGQVREAAEIAQKILDPLPYCLKANLILGVVWKETGLPESDTYLQRALALDPTNQVAWRLFGTRLLLQLTPARVPRYIEGAPSAPPPLTFAPLQPTPTAEPFAPAEPMIVAPSFETPTSKMPLESPPAEPTGARAPEPELPLEPLPKPHVGDTTLPPWLLTSFPESVEAKAAPPAPTQPAEPATETPTEVPPWLAHLRGEITEPTAETTIGAPAEETETEAPTSPPWIRKVTASEETAPTLPPWISEETKTEGVVPETAAPTAEELPPWMREAERPGETPTPVTERPTDVPSPTPLWLRDLQAQPTTAPQAAEQQAELAPQVEAPAPVTVGETAPPMPAESPEPAAPAPKRKRQPKGYSRLVQARAHRDANQMQDALAEYDYVVQHGPRLVNDVIEDLEILIRRLDVPLEAHRILGDAYTRADRLAEALERYRFVLDHISA